MGQYYSVAIKGEDGVINYNKRKIIGEGYIMAKLLEHSYFGNHLVDSVANLLLNHKCQLAWVGDYAEQEELDDITNFDITLEKVWYDDDAPVPLERNEVRKDFLYRKFNYGRKYLVNWDKGEYISFADYKKNYKFPNKTLVISPIPLMTAIGNNRGGGDYYEDNPNYDKVGSWAWDKISITGKIPSGFKKLDIYFKDEWIKEEEERIEEDLEKNPPAKKIVHKKNSKKQI